MSYIEITANDKREIIEYLKSKKYPNRLQSRGEKKSFYKKAIKFHTEDDVLYYRLSSIKSDGETHTRLLEVFSSDESRFINRTIGEIHGAMNHRGALCVFKKINEKFYGITRKQVEDYVKNCEHCQGIKSITTRPQIMPIKAYYPKERLVADLVDLRIYSQSNEDYGWLFVGVDAFSKFAVTFPIRSKSATEVVKCFNNFVFRYGAPYMIHTDNGKEFNNSELNRLCEKYEIKKVNGLPRRPWVQGKVERLNQTLKRMLTSAMHDGKCYPRWTEVLDEVTYQYNTCYHSATRKRPFDIFNIAGDVRNIISDEKKENLKYECLVEDVPTDENYQYSKYVFNIQSDIADAAKNLNRAADRMIAKCRWANDDLKYNLNERVFVRVYTDANNNTKKLKFSEHLNTKVYVVSKIHQYNIVDVMDEKTGKEVIERISTRDLIRIKNKNL